MKVLRFLSTASCSKNVFVSFADFYDARSFQIGKLRRKHLEKMRLRSACFATSYFFFGILIIIVFGESETEKKGSLVPLPPTSRALINLFLCCNQTILQNTDQRIDDLDEYCGSGSGGDTEKIWTAEEHFLSNGSEQISFSLEKRSIPCKTGDALYLDVSSDEVSTKGRNVFYPNGYLRRVKEFYAPDEFCIQRITKDVVSVKLCPPDCGKTRACIPKCCTPDKIYGIGARKVHGCHYPKGNTYFDPPLYDDLHTRSTNALKPHYFLWNPKDFKHNCFEKGTTIMPLSETIAHNITTSLNSSASLVALHLRIRKDGAVLFNDILEKKCRVESEPKHFMCIDGVQDYGEEESASFSNLEDEYILHICAGWSIEDLLKNDAKFIFGIMLLVTSVFPMMTSGIYISLWRRQSVHGWTIAATCGTLFLMYLLQGTALVLSKIHKMETLANSWGCKLIGIMGHFVSLAAFSWMTVMSGDLWCTFRAVKPSSRRSNSRIKFLKYSAFGWGVPTGIVLTGILLDYTYSTNDCTFHLLPGYGTLSCWVSPSSQGAYIYYPMGILLSLNITFFALTCYKLLHYRQARRCTSKNDAHNWTVFVRFVKLFLVMGVSWISDTIQWTIHGLEINYYWIIFDVINILRAIGVFVVYACREDILLMLEETYPRLKKYLRPIRRRSKDLEQTGSTALVASPTTLQGPPDFEITEN